MQGHCVHVVGLDGAWGRELPGVVADGGGRRSGGGDKDGSAGEKGGKMKIAYRYERLGVLGEVSGRDRGACYYLIALQKMLFAAVFPSLRGRMFSSFMIGLRRAAFV